MLLTTKLSYRFKRDEHLKRRSEIREVFNKGKRYNAASDSGLALRLFVLKNNLQYNRICFTFASGRKFGNAVARNRAKRVAREAYRLLKNEIKGGHDLILMLYRNPDEANMVLSERQKQLKFLFKKAGLFL